MNLTAGHLPTILSPSWGRRYAIFSVQDHHPALPRTGPELYPQVSAQCELAESLGYDTLFVAEHHFPRIACRQTA